MNALAELAEFEGTREFIKITNDVTLVIDHDPYLPDMGILRFSNGCEVEFAWSDDAIQAFKNIDTIDAVEILTIIAQKADGK